MSTFMKLVTKKVRQKTFGTFTHFSTSSHILLGLKLNVGSIKIFVLVILH